MKSYRARGGPVSEKPYCKLPEIEQICTDALRKVGLYPEKPEPIRIERFVEKHFKIRPEYHELPDGLLGYTKFGPRGVEQIVVSRSLAEQGDRVADRQVSSTLAHEAGHGLLQGHLFVLERDQLTSLFGEGIDPQVPKILCRTPRGGRVGDIPASGGSFRQIKRSVDFSYRGRLHCRPLLISQPQVAPSVRRFCRRRKGKKLRGS